ncbi:DNA primase family protein [Paenibacillus sp. FSL L8-0641]|uniref:DNA primase family protein n=1 Tax=Paenibacillus sp. FSL L8-0641 TaxID=2921605 RepID=UPI0030FC0FF2
MPNDKRIRINLMGSNASVELSEEQTDTNYEFFGEYSDSVTCEDIETLQYSEDIDILTLCTEKLSYEDEIEQFDEHDDHSTLREETIFYEVEEISKAVEVENVENFKVKDNNTRFYKTSSDRGNFVPRVEWLMLNSFEMISSADGISIYQTKQGYYKHHSDSELAVLIRKNLTEDQNREVSRRKMDEVAYRLKTHPDLWRKFNDLNTDTNLINFRDGVLDLRERRVLPHDPKYCFTSFIDADCKVIPRQKANNRNYSYSSVFERFLTDCTEGDEAKQASLQQMVGYIISNHFNAKKMFVLIGEPHTGKSVWLSLLQILIGKEHTTSMTLKQLGANRFMQTRLAHSKLNISPEMSDDGDLKGVEFIKAVTGGDLITGDRKGEAAIDFYGRTKLVAAGNHMPKLAKHDGTTAFIDRLLFITFNNSIPEEQRDRFLLQKLLEERHIIIKWALEGLYQLIDNNFIFTECDEAIQFKKKYMAELNNVTEFVNDMCVVEPENDKSRVHRTRLYDAYIIYCKENGLTSVKKTDFWREIEKFRVRSGKIRVEGSTPLMGYRGIRLLSPDEYTHT